MQNNSYICGRVGRLDPLLKVETRTPFPTTFCSGLQKTGEMKTIPLSQGFVALVDDEDYDFLMQWKWHVCKRPHTYYATKNSSRLDGPQKTISMHRLIMNTPNNMEVDHINHNGLDCQKSNMRNCTKSQNQLNKNGSGGSGFVGVCVKHNKINGKIYKNIQARIMVKGKAIHLGSFKTEEEAAIARDIASKKYFGEFANLNFKD